ncbi:MAG: alanine racemase [Actinoplanes sp.]
MTGMAIARRAVTGEPMAAVHIDLGALAHNTALLARAAAPGQLMAVVKADGFGHGAVPVARAALDAGATWLGVTSAAEALALRRAGVGAPILMWLYPPNVDFDELLRARIDVSVADPDSLAAVGEAARRTGRRANVHLKVDTGLSRGGSPPEHWAELVTAAERAGFLRVRGVWSHLANAEDPADPGLHRQLAMFADARAAAAGLDPPLTHLANSAATLQLPQARFDLVRTGIALYGIEPVPGRTFGLRPVMTVRAQVILTRRIKAGTGVSYGPDWVTPRDTTVALIPVGFADGVPRVVSGRGQVAVDGVRYPIVGRIAMDQFLVDVGDDPVRPGDVAVLFGPGTSGEPTAADWAGWAGTNPHEILTGIGPRLPRCYP